MELLGHFITLNWYSFFQHCLFAHLKTTDSLSAGTSGAHLQWTAWTSPSCGHLKTWKVWTAGQLPSRHLKRSRAFTEFCWHAHLALDTWTAWLLSEAPRETNTEGAIYTSQNSVASGAALRVWRSTKYSSRVKSVKTKTDSGCFSRRPGLTFPLIPAAPPEAWATLTGSFKYTVKNKPWGSPCRNCPT